MPIQRHEVRNIIHENRLQNNQIRFLSINLTSFLKTFSCQGFEGRIYYEFNAFSNLLPLYLSILKTYKTFI